MWSKEPSADAEGLTKLATWCTRYSPLVALDPPDGVWIEVGGSAHLFGGEAALLATSRASPRSRQCSRRHRRHAWSGMGCRSLRCERRRSRRYGQCHRRVAGGCPSFDARYGGRPKPRRGRADRATRGHAERSLTRRFGSDVRRRLNQALGHAAEPFDALIPPEIDPAPPRLCRADRQPARPLPASSARGSVAISAVTSPQRRSSTRRLERLSSRTRRPGLPSRSGEDGKANRDPAHLARLLADRLDFIDPGFG